MLESYPAMANMKSHWTIKSWKHQAADHFMWLVSHWLWQVIIACIFDKQKLKMISFDFSCTWMGITRWRNWSFKNAFGKTIFFSLLLSFIKSSLADYTVQYSIGQSEQTYETRRRQLYIELHYNRYNSISCSCKFLGSIRIPINEVKRFSLQDIEDLYKLQCAEWDPIIQWFNKRFETDIEKCCDISQPKISPRTRMSISRHILSYGEGSMHAFNYAVDTLKSVILTLACVEKRISVEKAVTLSRLEEEYQLKFWGRVEWAHDLNQQDTQARLAACILYIHFHSNDHLVKEKLKI